MSINATAWYDANWACEKGLFASVSDSAEQMDEAIDSLVQKLVHSNPEAMTGLKQIFWRGTEDWDELLDERAAMSGQLVLSTFSKNAIEKFKKK